MTVANAVTALLLLSILLIVFALGARATLDDALYLFRRPALLFRAATAIYIAVPAVALAIALLFPLVPEARFAIIALSVSPIPPILPNKMTKVGSPLSYDIGLLVAAAILSLVMTPILYSIAVTVLGDDGGISPGRVARTLLISIGLPLAAGLAARHFAPKVTAAVQPYAARAGMLFLVVGALALFTLEAGGILELVGNGTILAIASVVLAGLLIGHLLGRPDESAALALAASTRHPGIAIAIGTMSYPALRATVLDVVLLTLLVNIAVTLPYVLWMKRRNATPLPSN